MRKIVRACAGHVSIRINSVCKELEPAGGIKSSAAVVGENARSCAMRVSIRTSSVCKELGHVGATMKPADEGQGNRALEGTPARLEVHVGLTGHFIDIRGFTAILGWS
jgi:hypothetical protein